MPLPWHVLAFCTLGFAHLFYAESWLNRLCSDPSLCPIIPSWNCAPEFPTEPQLLAIIEELEEHVCFGIPTKPVESCV